jgi:hypothetical protein
LLPPNPVPGLSILLPTSRWIAIGPLIATAVGLFQ